MPHGYPDWSPLATGSASELPTYGFDLGFITVNAPNAEYPFVLFNPANSRLVFKLRRLTAVLVVAGFADAQHSGTFRLWSTTTGGTGTLTGINNHDATKAPSGLQLRTAITAAPSVSRQITTIPFVYERKRALEPSRFDVGSLHFVLNDHPPAGQVEPQTFYPGEGLAAVLVSTANGLTCYLQPEWTEEPYS